MHVPIFKRASLLVVLFALLLISTSPIHANGNAHEGLLLDSSTKQLDLYPSLYIIKDNDKALHIEDVIGVAANDFVHSEDITQKGGFFEAAKWFRVDLYNQSDKKQWLLELAFPLIYYIEIYSLDESGLTKLHEAGTIFPFSQRKVNHRNFVFDIDVDPNKKKTIYMLLHGAGDLHPPMKIWNVDAFIEKTQMEFSLLGIFYGMIMVMIVYNLFLYFSLRLRSYLYYVLAITSTMVGQLSLNGIGFQHIWSNAPEWNLISTPFWVSLACIFIILFAKSFLDTDRYFPKFRIVSYMLIALNSTVIIVLFVSNLVALNIMLLSTLSTFVSVLSIAFMSLRRGVREARFFIIGWVFFLVGIVITILERATVLPVTDFNEYAGQFAMGLEVVFLSLALADRIHLMRKEKELAVIDSQKSQLMALETLQRADVLKDEFLTNTSHELRTPLHGIIGIAETLRDGVAGEITDHMHAHLSMIATSGKRLSNLINDILDLAKLRNNELKLTLAPVQLKELIDVVLTICSPLVKHKPIAFNNHVAMNLPPVYVDENRVQQILFNLIGNAIAYTEKGHITVSALLREGVVEVRVSDTGKGIPADEIATIFDPFYQVDIDTYRTAAGTGIGLSITKRLVELHDGEIQVQSGTGVGSTFCFTLPIWDETTMPVVAAEEVAVASTEALLSIPYAISTVAPSVRDTAKKNGNILIADDESINLQVLTNQLALEGYDVVSVRDGLAVMEQVEENVFDLLIIDIMMPNMSGYEVCRRLRERYSLTQLPILMLTAKSQVQDIVTAFEVGANDYVTKPCDRKELLSRVETLIQLRHMNAELVKINQSLEEKVAERTDALAQANDSLTMANAKLVHMTEARRQLLANISHELGTPITLIQSYVQAVQEGLIHATDTRYVTMVAERVNVLERLTQDLFDLSKLEAEHMNLEIVELNLESWLKGLILQCEQEVMQRERRFVYDATDDQKNQFSDYICRVDIERMTQVFSNLIRNAVRHTSAHDGTISFGVRLADDVVIVSVTDNGSGMEQEQLPFLFERFYRVNTVSAMTRDETGGTGLGLAIVKEIVEHHQGSVSVESRVHEGSTFHVALPVWKGIYN